MLRIRLHRWALLLQLLLMPAAFAGPGVNNGGGGWACRNEKQELIWFKSIERFQVEWNAFHYRDRPDFSNRNALSIANDFLSFLRKQAPVLHAYLPESAEDFMRKVIWLSQNLPIIDDGQIDHKPPLEWCHNGKISYAQVANYLIDGNVLMDETLWHSPQVEELDRGILISHEILYRALRERLGVTTSESTQRVVAEFFSTANSKDRLRELNRVLESGSGDRSSSRLILTEVDLTCVAYTTPFDGVRSKSYKAWKKVAHGESLRVALDGFTFFVGTSMQDGRPYEMTIKDQSSNILAKIQDDLIFPAFREYERVTLTLNARGLRAVLACFNKR